MREILFRGKRINNGEWAYGDLLTCDDEMEIYSESHGENGGWECSCPECGTAVNGNIKEVFDRFFRN